MTEKTASVHWEGRGKKGQGKAVEPGSSGLEQISGDEFTFYPDPVPPNPEKDHSPTYETPITMPERR